MAPAYPKAQLKRIYDQTGVTSYCPNIEVWDENHFPGAVPRQGKWIGHKEWVRRTLDAVEIFGKGPGLHPGHRRVELAASTDSPPRRRRWRLIFRPATFLPATASAT